ncbi:PilZ domain-containing protein [Teredinibacter franksiae]|jgi:PilZ domain.|uniref:PilZ domain-containing protein n=1 Tax=Teredinibacter franksiae TaxID=2761453 RepID=UPI001629BF2D|nr:PilZ domain-containing protein [Teredinibacter franksiae]
MTLANRDYLEKRNFIRMKVDTPIDILLTRDHESLQGICRDLSGGGLLVEVPTALPIGTSAEVSIQSSHGHSPMLHARVRVSRVEAQPDTTARPCLLGMEIEEVLAS